MVKTIHIGGEDRPIDFNFNCLEEFEELTGMDPLNGLKVTIKSAKVLLFCGLKYGKYPEGCESTALDFDLKRVGSWMNSQELVRVLEAFNSQGQTEEKKTEIAEALTQ